MAIGGFAVAAACALTSLGVAAAPAAQVSGTPAAHGERASRGQARTSATRPAGRPGVKVVRYRGYAFSVPSAWPVYDDRRLAHGCVRFDQHAVYLGPVPADQSCPSWLLGTTEAVLIQAGPAGTRRLATEDPVARQVSAQAPGVAVFATFDTDPTVIYRILASASLPAPVIREPGTGGAPPAAAGPPGGQGLADGGAALARPRAGRGRRPMAAPPLPEAVASYHGMGFDACSAPSTQTMSAWHRHSPYRAIGIYIGGADRACAQPNLSQRWVRAEARAGWRFIPLYAGPQAAFGEIHAPGAQGRAAAQDAVNAMRRLGFGRRTPVYYDMEAFGPRSRVHALRFLSAWTTELHRLGYTSGVYSSSDSGIADLSRQYARHVFAMPNVIYDALWNGAATTRDRNLRTGQWHDERIHQFSGNVTQRFGGHTINIDKDVLDVRLRRGAATAQPSSAVTLPDGSVDLFYRGQGNRIWLDRYAAASGWERPVRTSADGAGVPSAVWTGSAVDVFYKGSDGHLWVGTCGPDGTWTGQRELSMMGVIGSAPRAVSVPGGIIDVFWRGSADDHLWHGQYLPGSGWNGPQGLGGNLLSAPAPVTSAPGATTVVWEGTDRSLWSVARGLSGRWSAPRSVGMGPLGGPPQATAQPDGGIQVYWHGSGNSFVWEGFFRPGRGWAGPRDLGGTILSAPWPATAAGTVRVLWRGPGHELDYIRHRDGKAWNAVGWQPPVLLRVGWLGSAPFAAVGDAGAPLRVFWHGRKGSLWTAVFRHSAWSAATRLAG